MAQYGRKDGAPWLQQEMDRVAKLTAAREAKKAKQSKKK